jgi:nitrogen fixation protein NifU and related proteins
MAGLEDLYREIILDHYRTPRNRGELDPPAIMAEGFNPLCGDEIKVFLLVENGKVEDIRIGGQGCSISQSSASMMSQAVKGKTVEEARAVIGAFKSMMTPPDPEAEHDHDEPKVKLGDLEALSGVQKFPVRIKCATLAWNTLAQAMDDAK